MLSVNLMFSELICFILFESCNALSDKLSYTTEYTL